MLSLAIPPEGVEIGSGLLAAVAATMAVVTTASSPDNGASRAMVIVPAESCTTNGAESEAESGLVDETAHISEVDLKAETERPDWDGRVKVIWVEEALANVWAVLSAATRGGFD